MRAVGTTSPERAAERADARGESAAADVIGALLLAGCAGWTLYTSGGRDAHPEDMLLALLAVAAGYAAGRVSGALTPSGAPTAAALTVALLVLITPGGLSGDPGAPPLQNADADGALLALAVGACCCAIQLARGTRRLLLVALAAALVGEALATGSVAGVLACGASVAVAGSAAVARRRLPTLAVLLLCAGLAAVAPVLLAHADTSGDPGAVTAAPLLDRRTALWFDAVQEATDAPLTGVGPGRFTELSSSAQSSATPGGASSAVLQVAAEQGLPGVALLAGAYGWMLWTLHRAPGRTGVVLTAAGALTALAAEAAVSPVLSFPGVTAGAGLLVGIASARPFADPSAAPSAAPPAA